VAQWGRLPGVLELEGKGRGKAEDYGIGTGLDGDV